MESSLISDKAQLSSFIEAISQYHGQPANLFVDLEGNDLSRHGTLSIVTVLVYSQAKTYLIDVTTLKDKAFSTASPNGSTLKSVFESDDVIKVFFDIRNDSDALFALYGVRVSGIEDLQLMELASRNFQKRCVNGLAKCIERDSELSFFEKSQWRQAKEGGRKLFAPECGGSYAVFDQRPLPSKMMDYCTQDVVHMPSLRRLYRAKLCDAWWIKIEAETRERIRLSQSPSFNGKGRHMALGPGDWMHWRPSSHEMLTRTLLQDTATRTESIQPCEELGSESPGHVRSEEELRQLVIKLRMDEGGDRSSNED